MTAHKIRYPRDGSAISVTHFLELHGPKFSRLDASQNSLKRHHNLAESASQSALTIFPKRFNFWVKYFTF